MDNIYELVCDRLEGWELAEILGISAREILLEFEDKVDQNIEELKEILNIDNETEKKYNSTIDNDND